VPAAQQHIWPGFSQALLTVLADRVEQAVAGRPAAWAAKQHRLRYQAIDQVSDRISSDAITRTHRFRRVEVK